MDRVRSFTSPDDFLKYVQQHFGHTMSPGEPDPEFLRRVEQHSREEGLDPGELQRRGLDLALAELQKKILNGVPKAAGENISKNVAIGTLDIGTVNARILRSPHSQFTIVVHRGLMLLLHKFAKGILAWHSPADVAYCNRKPADRLTRDDLRGYTFELIENCQKHGAPYGALLLLKPEVQSRQAGIVYHTELFVLCHELGHFLNGDLEDDQGFVEFQGETWMKQFVENRSHQQEYSADETAFRLMQAVLRHSSQAESLRLLPAIVLLFNLFCMLGGVESAFHPHPLERSRNLIETFFGHERARMFEESYSDPRQLHSLFAKV